MPEGFRPAGDALATPRRSEGNGVTRCDAEAGDFTEEASEVVCIGGAVERPVGGTGVRTGLSQALSKPLDPPKNLKSVDVRPMSDTEGVRNSSATSVSQAYESRAVDALLPLRSLGR